MVYPNHGSLICQEASITLLLALLLVASPAIWLFIQTFCEHLQCHFALGMQDLSKTQSLLSTNLQSSEESSGVKCMYAVRQCYCKKSHASSEYTEEGVGLEKLTSELRCKR